MSMALSIATLVGSFGPIAEARAQNLVPNGSFEEYTECPWSFSQWYQVADWTSYFNQSADYFNTCALNDVCGVPFNNFGYQEPADGEAYVGVATFLLNLPVYREMVAATLLEPLQVGVPVCLSFRMAMGCYGSWEGNSARYTNKGVGIKFFNEVPTDWNNYLCPNSAAVYLEEVPTDTAIWYTVSGTYVPDSAYTSLIVANFFSDSISEVILFDTVGVGNWNTAYAFIDDVRVSFDLQFCEQANALREGEQPSLEAYPNPSTGDLSLVLPWYSDGFVIIEVQDALGRVAASFNALVQDHVALLDLNPLSPGNYVLRASDNHGRIASVSVVHISP